MRDAHASSALVTPMAWVIDEAIISAGSTDPAGYMQPVVCQPIY